MPACCSPPDDVGASRPLPDPDVAGNVVRRHRLLEPVDVVGLPALELLDRGIDVPGAVDVHHQLHVRARWPRARAARARSLPRANVGRGPADLQRGVAPFDVFGGLLGQLLGRQVVGAVGVGGDALARWPPRSADTGAPSSLPLMSQRAKSIAAMQGARSLCRPARHRLVHPPPEVVREQRVPRRATAVFRLRRISVAEMSLVAVAPADEAHAADAVVCLHLDDLDVARYGCGSPDSL